MSFEIYEEWKSQYQTHSRTSWLHRLIYDWAWPWYECESCMGQEYGCYCQYYDAPAPGKAHTRWHLFWRWVWDHRA